MASSHGTDASKASLRNGYLSLCESMPKEFSQRIDADVRKMFAMLDLYKESSLVLGYLSIHEEIDVLPILREALAAGKRVALPYLNPKTNALVFYEVDSLDHVIAGSRGLSCPPAQDADPLCQKDFFGSLCLVPGLVFDGEGNRVGYGAGYYDAFLAYYPGDKVGLVRSVQVSSNPLPHEQGDIAVDVLVTEGSIWRCRKI
ncbi:MAG: 5-formyltetrahydrofolate cyclo-ligase [Coriobacteriales bacterium]|nr:5-formyltetrahydrofolate cyclo-ligase [Coriobacteriales bacterium]